jgi:hypothetical protein
MNTYEYSVTGPTDGLGTVGGKQDVAVTTHYDASQPGALATFYWNGDFINGKPCAMYIKVSQLAPWYILKVEFNSSRLGQPWKYVVDGNIFEGEFVDSTIDY